MADGEQNSKIIAPQKTVSRFASRNIYRCLKRGFRVQSLFPLLEYIAPPQEVNSYFLASLFFPKSVPQRGSTEGRWRAGDEVLGKRIEPETGGNYALFPVSLS